MWYNFGMNKDILDLLFKYQNKWVALKDDLSEILFSAGSVKDIEIKLRESRINNAVVTFINPADKPFSPLCRG